MRWTTDERLLVALAHDESEDIRSAVAFNRHTPSVTLDSLAQDASARVRRTVAANSNSSSQSLITLATDVDEFVRSSVAHNPSCPEELLERLALDPNDRVRTGVAGNPRTSATILDGLASDQHLWVRQAVASHAATSQGARAALAGDEHVWVRETVARQPLCPIEVLVTLAHDAKWQVRVAVAKNAARRDDCPASLITLLANDRTKSVKLAIAQKPDLPAEVAQALSAQGLLSDSALSEASESDFDSIEKIRAIKSTRQRAKLLERSTDPDTLAAFASDDSTTVRLAVIKNSHTPDPAINTVLGLCQGNVWVGINANFVFAAIRHPNASEETLIQAASLANGTNLAALLQREPPISFNLYIAVIALEVGSTFLTAADRSLRKRCEEFSEEQWRLAAQYQDKQVRQLVAMNPKTPEHLFAQLALDPEADVRKAVVKNRHAPATARTSAALLDGS